MSILVDFEAAFSSTCFYQFDCLTPTLSNMFANDFQKYHSCYLRCYVADTFYGYEVYDLDSLLHIIEILTIYHKCL